MLKSIITVTIWKRLYINFGEPTTEIFAEFSCLCSILEKILIFGLNYFFGVECVFHISNMVPKCNVHLHYVYKCAKFDQIVQKTLKCTDWALVCTFCTVIEPFWGFSKNFPHRNSHKHTKNDFKIWCNISSKKKMISTLIRSSDINELTQWIIENYLF